MKHKALRLSTLILLLACTGVALMHALQPDQARSEHPSPPPRVTVRELVTEPRRYTTRAFGAIEPALATTVISTVSGTIIRVSPKFYSGGLFAGQEAMLELDSTEYRATVSRARAALATTQHRLARESLLAEQALDDFRSPDMPAPSSLALREPQLAEARAEVEAARDAVRSAEDNLRRTTIRAPFVGMVRSKSVELGQYLEPGAVVAEFCDLSVLEIRLPLTIDQARRLELAPGELPTELQWPVRLSSRNATLATARLIRAAGDLDRQTRTLTAVARLNPSDANVWLGMFLEAEILGPDFTEIIPVPEEALTTDNRLATVGPDNRLTSFPAHVAHRSEGEAWIRTSPDLHGFYCVPAPTPLVSGMIVDPCEDSTRNDAMGRQP